MMDGRKLTTVAFDDDLDGGSICDLWMRWIPNVGDTLEIQVRDNRGDIVSAFNYDVIRRTCVITATESPGITDESWILYVRLSQ